jgi:hypothetical protein
MSNDNELSNVRAAMGETFEELKVAHARMAASVLEMQKASMDMVKPTIEEREAAMDRAEQLQKLATADVVAVTAIRERLEKLMVREAELAAVPQ